MIEKILHVLSLVTLVLFANALLNGIFDSDWNDVTFYIGIVAMAILYIVWQSILKRIELSSYRIEIVVNFIGTLTIVLILGYFLEWYGDTLSLCCIILEVAVIFVIGYFLGMTKTNTKVEEINQALKEINSK